MTVDYTELLVHLKRVQNTFGSRLSRCLHALVCSGLFLQTVIQIGERNFK